MTDRQPNPVESALAAIGCDEDLRARFLQFLKEVEAELAEPDLSVRDEITGPIIDALHADVGILTKHLQSGLQFDFHYRSKIAREIVMSPDDVPDHVWEPQTTKTLSHLAEGAKTAIVGGAYSGDQVIFIANALRENGGTCHAFEPNGDQRAMLERNARNNGLGNVTVSGLGLWSDDQSSMMLVGDDSFAHPEVVDGGNGDAGNEVFRTTSIDAYCKAHGIERLDLIMLDIEGAELEALKGAQGFLSQISGEAPNVVFEVHRHYVDWSKGLENTEIVRLMTGHGYTVYALRDFNSNVALGDAPVELVPVERCYLDGPPHGFNMLAVKSNTIVEDGPFKVCPDVSPKLLWHRDPKLHHPLNAA